MKPLLFSAVFFAASLVSLAQAAKSADTIVDANKKLGRGINLGNALEAPQEGEWGVRLKAEYFAAIKKAGFDSVRLPVKWSAHAATEVPNTIEPAFAERVDWAIDQALANKLNIVVNVHHYGEMDSNPAEHLPRLLGLWEQIATRYKDRPATVYFELLNEPHDKLTEADWNAAIPQILSVVRKSNPERPVIVGPGQWNGIRALDKLKLPNDPNLIVTVHCYDPFQFTHQGTSWVKGSDAWKGKTWTGTQEEQTAIRKSFDIAANWSKINERPLYLGEFGAFSASDMESRARWTRFVTREAEARGFSWSYWEFCAGFGAYDPATDQWRDELKLALLSTNATATATGSAEPENRPSVVRSEFIYETAPFPSCHASTIVETKAGLVAAWFGGTAEGKTDVGVWLSRHDGRSWSVPVEIADGKDAEGKQYPCWNPVLFDTPEGLHLYYKVGPSPSRWWGMVKRSLDSGMTWSAAEKLPEGILGPIKNKPVRLTSGLLLSGSSTEHDGWRLHLESSADLGRTWSKTDSLNDGKEFGAIQPTILQHAGGKLQMLCRSRQKKILETWSSDEGKRWSPLRATELPNPNSGIDAVTLKSGRQLLIYNHTERGRAPLNIAHSDDGKAWKVGVVLENVPGEYSYPAIIQSADGLVHATYTWNRKKIRHVVIDPAKLAAGEIREGKWPD